jgi:hypothetical protein
MYVGNKAAQPLNIGVHVPTHKVVKFGGADLTEGQGLGPVNRAKIRSAVAAVVTGEYVNIISTLHERKNNAKTLINQPAKQPRKIGVLTR